MSDFLDTPLLKSSQYPNWTIRNAVEGIQIFGGIGSGKSSGSGKFFAQKYLSHGFGGLVLTAKTDEKQVWIDYCTQNNRLDDLIIIEPHSQNGSTHSFDFIDYEAANLSQNEGLTANLVKIFKTVIRSDKAASSNNSSQDPFWEEALEIHLYNVIDLCLLRFKSVSFDNIYDIIASIPQDIKQLSDDGFKRSSLFAQIIAHLHSKVQENLMSDEDLFLWRKLEHYFITRYIPLSQKTKSIIEFSIESFFFHLSREPFYSIFCPQEASTITPDDCCNGKIILLNLPVKKYGKVGRDLQIMFKYIWQCAMERRDMSQFPKPVFLWADEAQNFIHEHDTTFQATARSARVCTVYITQNIPNYLAHLGGDSANSYIHSFLGTLGTKIFHANSDIQTNEFASSLFGEHFREIDTHSRSYGEGISISENPNLQKLPRFAPEDFVTLKTGAEENDYVVEGIVHLHRQIKQAGKLSPPYQKLSFNQ
jgi:hypothetical protein